MLERSAKKRLMSAETTARMYWVSTFVVSTLLIGFSFEIFTKENREARAAVHACQTERWEGPGMTAPQLRACYDRAAISAAAREKEGRIAIVAAMGVFLLGSLMAFTVDFWASYCDFVDREIDWAGYAKEAEIREKVATCPPRPR